MQPYKYILNQNSIMNKITLSIEYIENQRILKRNTIMKKSNWLGIWKKRNMIMFQNRIAFYADDRLKEQPTCQIYLGDVRKIQDCGGNGSKLKIQSRQFDYLVQFQDQKCRQDWQESVSNAVRNYKLKKSQFMSKQKFRTRKDSIELEGGCFACY